MAKVAIVGGGPGGLATALALHRRGIAVHVFERASTFSPFAGGGFGLAFNGASVLKALSPELHAKVTAISLPLRNWALGDDRSGVLKEMPDRNDILQMGDGSPALAGCMRAEVLALQLEALPPGTVTMGADVTCVSAGGLGRGARLLVRTSGGGGGGGSGEELEFDAVIAADGIRSHMRETVFGPGLPQPAYSGAEIFYGIPAPTTALTSHPFAGVSPSNGGGWVYQALGVKRYFISAPCRIHRTAASFGLPSGSNQSVSPPVPTAYYGYVRAKPLEEVVASVKKLRSAASSSSITASEQQWEASAEPSAASSSAGGGTGSGVGLTVSGEAAMEDLTHEIKQGNWGSFVEAAVSGTDPRRLIRFPMFYRPPLPHWHKGRVALLGDAAHAPLPSAGQGLNMALEDAYCVGNLLADALQGLQPGEGHGSGLWRADVTAAMDAAAVRRGAPATGSQLDAAITSAFSAYQAKRQSKTDGIVSMSRQLLAMEIGAPNRLVCTIRNSVMGLLLPSVMKQMKANIAKDPVV